MNNEWAIRQLEHFLDLTELFFPPEDPYSRVAIIGDTRQTRGSEDGIVAQAQVVEQILDRVLPDWRTTTAPDRYHRWNQMREAAGRAVAQLQRQDELQRMLGPNTPTLDTSGLHPWVWDAASTFWQAESYRVAVAQAAASISAHTQQRLGRRDLADDALMGEAFSDKPAEPGKPRLRLPDAAVDKTQESRQRGARSLAQACYWALRNPATHNVDEWTVQVALEALCALSLLARFIEECDVLHPAP